MQAVPLPLVAIGIPTYNRANLVARAIESALAQDYPNVLVIISDNASADETPALCEKFARSDPRVSYFRHAANVGATGNFSSVLKRASGEFFMWLADDDWLDPTYVSRCVEVLRGRPDVVLVGGAVKYFRGGRLASVGNVVACEGSQRERRVFDYYRQVDDNGIFYGVMRHAHAVRVELVNCFGGDWLFMAAMAYQGRLHTNQSAMLNRDLGGNSESAGKMAATLGLPSWQTLMPMTLPLAANAAKDIFQRSTVYRDAPGAARLPFALLVFCWICLIKPVQALKRRVGAGRSLPSHQSEGSS